MGSEPVPQGQDQPPAVKGPEPAGPQEPPARRGKVLAGVLLSLAAVVGLYLINRYWIRPVTSLSVKATEAAGNRVMAPEFYNNLKYHTSWTRLLFQFIFDERYSLYSRIERMKQRVSSPAIPHVTTGRMSGVDLSARPITF